MARSLRSLSASSAAAPTHRSILYHRGKIQGAVIRPGAVNPAQRVTRLWTTPNIPGKSLLAVEVDYAPGAASPSHTHAKSAFIYAYVISGAIESKVNDGE